MEAIHVVVTCRCEACELRDGGERPGWCECRGTGRVQRELGLEEFRELLARRSIPIGGGESVSTGAPAALGPQTGSPLAGALPLVAPEPSP